jgi:hypothetical protein
MDPEKGVVAIECENPVFMDWLRLRAEAKIAEARASARWFEYTQLYPKTKESPEERSMLCAGFVIGMLVTIIMYLIALKYDVGKKA